MHGMNVSQDQSLLAIEEDRTQECEHLYSGQLVEGAGVGVGQSGQSGRQEPLAGGCGRSGFEGRIARYQGPVAIINTMHNVGRMDLQRSQDNPDQRVMMFGAEQQRQRLEQ